MSTFLVGLVVAAATVFVIRVALSDPDQPATIRRTSNRDRPRRPPAARRKRPAPRHAPRPPAHHRRPAADRPATPPPDTRLGPDAVRGRPRREAARGWARVRSGVALVILVTFVGVLMALTTGAVLALAARALRQAVG